MKDSVNLSEYHFRQVDMVVREQTTEQAINGPDAVVRFCQKHFGDRMQEHFIVVGLDGRHRPIGWWLASKGTATASLVHPREVFQPAVRDGAVAIIVVHNHPSGDVGPSSEDKAVTDRLKDAGHIMGIPLVDHMIVSSDGHYSFKTEGEL